MSKFAPAKTRDSNSESGTIGAPAAIGNAVIDALWHRGVRDIALPITAETVWRALKTAQENPPRD